MTRESSISISSAKARKSALADADIVFKIVLGIFAAVISYFTYDLNRTLGDLKNRLDADRFGLEVITTAYDRVDRYLALDAGAQRMKQRSEAIILYVQRISNPELSTALWSILMGASDPAVRDAAIDNTLTSVPAGTEVDASKFTEGFTFARNAGGRSTAYVYICSNATDLSATVALATKVGEALSVMDTGGNAGTQFGRVVAGEWRDFDGVVPVAGQITYVLDPEEKTASKGASMKNAIAAVAPAGVDQVTVDNPGQKSEFLYSIVVCI